MNCPECHDFLQRRLDGQTPAEQAALDHHLAQCANCREQHLVAQRLASGLRLLVPPAPPSYLARRIAMHVLADRADRLRWRRRAFAAAAVAACLALMTFAGYQAQRFGLFGPAVKDNEQVKKDNRHQDDTGSPRKESLGPDREAPPSLDQTLGEAGSLALALTRRTAGETMSQARQWLPRAKPLSVPLPTLKGSPSLAPVLGEPAQSLRQASHNVSAGLQPVAASARRAIDLLLHEIPALNPEQRSGS
jgi:hypothetical protein